MDFIRTVLTGYVLLLIACGPGEKVSAGFEAPRIEAELTDGSVFDLEDTRGNLVLVDFWGSWCGPCLKEMPDIVRIHDDYGSRGLTVVSIALEKREGVWPQVVERFGMDWEHQIVRDIDFVRFDEIASAYGVTDIPAKFLLDEAGRFIAIRPTIQEVEEILSARLD